MDFSFDIIKSIKVTVDREYDIDVLDMMVLSETNLKEATENQAALHSWWGVALAESNKKLAMLNKKLNKARSDLTMKYRKESDDNLYKWTLADIEARILADTIYSSLQDTIRNEEYNKDLIRNIRDSLEHRKEMIINLGAQLRSEK